MMIPRYTLSITSKSVPKALYNQDVLSIVTPKIGRVTLHCMGKLLVTSGTIHGDTLQAHMTNDSHSDHELIDQFRKGEGLV